MSQQINLFDPRFRPQAPHFSALTLVLAACGVLVALIAIGQIYAYQNRRLDATFVQTEQRVKQLQEQTIRLSREWGQQGRNTALADELARAEEQLRQRRALLERIQGGSATSVEGFSPYLSALARQTMQGVWLTGVEVAGNSGDLVLKGRVTDSDLVPVYIQRLNREPIFQGRPVRELHLAAKAEAGRRYVEFSLQIPVARGAS